jgi:fatty acid desaturase
LVHARLAASGYLAFLLSRTWWAIPAFLLYGIIYSGGISIRHECIHGTPFRSVWLNETFYFICAAMEQIDIVETSWSHTTHHSYTIMTPIDPEIITRRRPGSAA